MSIGARFRQQFERFSPGDPVCVRAPGRVNLIGEHTDYNDGFVLPVAIDRETRVAFAAGGGSWRIASEQFPDEVEWRAGRLPSTRQDHWSDYVCGVLHELAGVMELPAGGLLRIESTIPGGAGLSSSAALEVAVARAVFAAAAVEPSGLEIARLCRAAENRFVGAQCGIMDMLVSTTARAGHATWIDCRSEEARFVPLPEGVEIAMADSGVRHALAEGEYNLRRRECAEACRLLEKERSDVQSLRAADETLVSAAGDRLGPLLLKRARHVVSENARVGRVVALFERAAMSGVDEAFWTQMAEVFAASHASLRDDYEVSCVELDDLVASALAEPGVHAARMTGGGFGGSIVALRDAGVRLPGSNVRITTSVTTAPGASLL